MGFSVTASHVILIVALLTAGAAASTAYWGVSGEMDEARRTDSDLQDEVAHTNMTVVGTPYYEAAPDRYTVNVTNGGTTVLRLSELTYLIDGQYNDDVESLTVTGAGTTDLWLPGETLVIKLSPITTAPTKFALVAGNGAATYYR